ncbi:hypothetical protein PAMC26577_32830 [Caballeronia sordidicola]|uniref:Uncharacterized protein n=1 Tax=Caballeronia sordidicola TaxID=196367 RepID=A0A242MCU8_CABSO|nr:hypothetical protein PAMC26577_32830 [Caballeronia sordidicola]
MKHCSFGEAPRLFIRRGVFYLRSACTRNGFCVDAYTQLGGHHEWKHFGSGRRRWCGSWEGPWNRRIGAERFLG